MCMRVEVPTDQEIASTHRACPVGYVACPRGPFQKGRGMIGRDSRIALGLIPFKVTQCCYPAVAGFRDSGIWTVCIILYSNN